MKKEINISFANFWFDFNPYKNFFTEILNQFYKVNVIKIDNVTENTELDLMICSCFGFPKHHRFKENFKKLYFSPENDTPDFNTYDYAFTHYDFDYERHIRFPHWVWYHYYREHNIDREYHNHFINEPSLKEDDVFNYRWDSIGMVISNGEICDPHKNDIIYEFWSNLPLSSGGRWRNSVGGPVVDKIEFLKYYRASLAFENSMSNGYVTEKLYEAFVANGLPIYWGDSKNAKLDFNPKAFIDVNDYPTIKDCINDVHNIITDKNRFMDIINTPRNFRYQEYENKILSKLIDIIENGKIFNHKYGRIWHLGSF